MFINGGLFCLFMEPIKNYTIDDVFTLVTKLEALDDNKIAHLRFHLVEFSPPAIRTAYQHLSRRPFQPSNPRIRIGPTAVNSSNKNDRQIKLPASINKG